MIPSYVKIDNEVLNIYTDENPILDINAECYCLLFNLRDYFAPIIIKATIKYVHIYRNQNRMYYVSIDDFVSDDYTINTFVRGEQFLIHFINEEGYVNTINQKRIRLDDITDFTKLTFPVQGFFTRTTLEAIKELYSFYLTIIHQDVTQQLTVINTLISKQ